MKRVGTICRIFRIPSVGRAWRLSLLALLVPLVVSGQTYSEMLDSLEEAQAMVRKFPDNIDLRLKKATWNIYLEQWNYAKEEYDRVLSRDPKNVAALYYRAFVNEKLHRYKYAKKDYKTMLRIVPGNFNGLLGLALVEQKDWHYTEAMNLINRVVQLYPDSAVAYAARAGIELERGMLELAEFDFTEAMRLAPANTDYIISRADVRLRMKDKRKAREDLDLAVAKGVPRPSLSELYARCKE